MIPDNLHIGPIPIHIFGLLLAAAFLAAGQVLGRELGRKGYDPDIASSALVWAAVGSLVGARLWLVVEDWPAFVRDPIGLLFTGSGFVFYGGLVGGALAVTFVFRKHGIPWWRGADAVAPALVLGQAIGRIGCQLSGDGDWGIASKGTPAGFEWLPSWFFSFDYPNNVLGSGVPMPGGGFPGYGTHLVPPVYPTPLYESMAAFALFALLWGLRKRIERPLVMFGLYMVVNGIERFLIEQIRVNAVYEFFGKTATQAEIIAVCMFVGGLALIFYQMRKPLPVLAVPKPAETPATTE
jgi:phosphatidylglycerol:prolipoprotein diacylglycerol transferase